MLVFSWVCSSFPVFTARSRFSRLLARAGQRLDRRSEEDKAPKRNKKPETTQMWADVSCYARLCGGRGREAAVAAPDISHIHESKQSRRPGHSAATGHCISHFALFLRLYCAFNCTCTGDRHIAPAQGRNTNDQRVEKYLTRIWSFSNLHIIQTYFIPSQGRPDFKRLNI